MKNDFASFIKLRNDQLEVTLSPLGASIFRIQFFGKDMILTPKNEKDFLLPYFYHGKTIGRLAGRILDGDKVILHGGDEGISTKYFSYEQYDNKVIFEYTSKDKESNCPGNFFLRVTYELSDNNLIVKYLGIVDKPCLVSLTNHSYFCLGEDCLDNLSLKLSSSRYIVTDDRLLPIKTETIPEKWNFKKFKSLSKCGEIDNFFLLDDGVISLKSSKIQLDIHSTFTGTQIYTDNFVDNVLTLLTDRLTRRGVAIEPQDSQLQRKELMPGETYEKSITYTFKKL